MPDVTTGIDLGGTRIKAVAIDGSGNILYRHYQSTDDADHTAWKNAVALAVQEIQSNTGTKTGIVGISAPGLPDPDNTAIAFMPGRLQGLENFDWTGFLNAKTYVLNDAIAAMMAEARFGAAANKKACGHADPWDRGRRCNPD